MRALALSFLLVACGQEITPRAARAALDAREYEVAAGRFEALIPAARGEQRFLLELDRLRALSHFDAPRAQAGFERLAEDHAARVTPQEVSLIAGELVSARAFEPAIRVMDLGMQRFPQDPKMRALMQRVIEASRASAQPDALKAINSLPYVSGGGD